MNNLKAFFLVFFSAAAIFGCTAKPSERVFESSFFVMGTVCDIKVISRSPEKAQEILRQLRGSLDRTRSEYDFYDDKSRVSKINEMASHGTAYLSGDEAVLIKRSLELSSLTHGAFDMTFTPLWELWKRCEKYGRLPTSAEIRTAKDKIGYKRISISPDGRTMKFSSKNIRINLGGIAKGIALLNCKDMADRIGADNVMINLGGDILALGSGRGDGWVVAIQDPFHPDKILKKMHVKDKMVLTSGIYQRYVTINGKRYHHIIDANTGLPAGDFSSVTLMLNADRESYVPSLAVFLMGRKKALEYLAVNRQIGCFLVGNDGSVVRNTL